MRLEFLVFDREQLSLKNHSVFVVFIVVVVAILGEGALKKVRFELKI